MRADRRHQSTGSATNVDNLWERCEVVRPQHGAVFTSAPSAHCCIEEIQDVGVCLKVLEERQPEHVVERNPSRFENT
jgi:hypothetical protein